MDDVGAQQSEDDRQESGGGAEEAAAAEKQGQEENAYEDQSRLRKELIDLDAKRSRRGSVNDHEITNLQVALPATSQLSPSRFARPASHAGAPSLPGHRAERAPQ